jgi:hypothetical protein
MRSTPRQPAYHPWEVPHTQWMTSHTTSRIGRHSSTSRQSRDTAPPPTRELLGRAPPRGSSPVRLQSGGAVLRRGLPIPLGPARRPTLPPRRAPHIPETLSGLTHQVVLCGIASRRSGASRSRCPRRRRPLPALSAEVLSSGRKVSPSRVNLSSSASPNSTRSKPPAGTICRKETGL